MGRLIVGSVLGLVLTVPSVSLACGMYVPRTVKLAEKGDGEGVNLVDALKMLDEAEPVRPTIALGEREDAEEKPASPLKPKVALKPNS